MRAETALSAGDMSIAVSGHPARTVSAALLPIMVATGLLFSAGADIYLVASAALLLIHLEDLVALARPLPAYGQCLDQT